ncbi:unnamed protein product [Eruca vesicaria subsp. sativa]|uniref:Uncharacterized protein n=1 Tax=Eruca vesicaria subsp. sativa TaxID=29727 RepID=A0ABC8M4C1_ERUVS|nr:unnamed protein product [Eruca vesicaria subsp. sativa]
MNLEFSCSWRGTPVKKLPVGYIVNEFVVFEKDKVKRVYNVVLESYIVDIPKGNTEEDTRMFVNTVVNNILAWNLFSS